MDIYEQVLTSGVAFFDSKGDVSREDWQVFIKGLNIEKNWPGIQGFGYSIPVPADQLQAHTELIRAEGFPDFSVKPPGERPFYTSIIYLEPFDWRNKRAFGYDMWSNDMRRAAMSRAQDTGNATLSGIITLVQETDKDVQKGFLFYLPVYHRGSDLQTLEARQKALRGWVYAPFRTKDLMDGILSGMDSPLENTLHLSVLKKRRLWIREGGDIGLFITLVPKVLE